MRLITTFICFPGKTSWPFLFSFPRFQLKQWQQLPVWANKNKAFKCMTSNGNWHIQFGINLAGQLQQIAKRFTKPAAAKQDALSHPVFVFQALCPMDHAPCPIRHAPSPVFHAPWPIIICICIRIHSGSGWTLLLLQFKFWLARLDFILKLFYRPPIHIQTPHRMQKVC